VGVCDASSVAGDCASINKDNGTLCNLNDPCLIDTQCTAGDCVGVKKQCPATGECRIGQCNSASGDCQEQLAAAGTACNPSDQCATGGSCTAEGNCLASAGLPDGTPCELPGCTLEQRCFGNRCICGDPPVEMAAPDLGMGPGSNDGCSMAAGRAPSRVVGLYALLLAAWIMTRRRRARAAQRLEHLQARSRGWS
jgi:hypothetical protein